MALIKKLFRQLLAPVLLLASVWGTVHAVRASVAHGLYHQAFYGRASGHAAGILRRCEAARRLYPRDFLFCLRAAEKAYAAGLSAEGDEAQERFLRSAEYWCDTGLALNPYKSRLRRLKARLLERTSVAAASEYWEQYVDWHFWEPRNHAYLVDLYARAGRFAEAAESLRWVEGSEYYSEASRAVRDAWAVERLPPGFDSLPAASNAQTGESPPSGPVPSP